MGTSRKPASRNFSYANRFSLYELKLNPDDPLQYDYDVEWRDISSPEVEIQVKLDDGALETRSRTIYESQDGPIINLKGVTELLDGWPIRLTGNSVLAFRDANLLTGVRGIEQWITKGQATSLDEYRAALNVIGNPLFHDIAPDRNGDAFYGEVSAIPFLTQTQLDSCVEPPLGSLLAVLTTNVILALDGSDSGCGWGNDPEAPEDSNLYGASALPQFTTTDYAGNGNNSYWLPDANNPLTGFPTIMGPLGHEGRQQFLRTRIGHLMVEERKNASDGLSETPLFDLTTLKDLMCNNRVYGAEIVLDDVLSICETNGASTVSEACAVLDAWDRKVNLDSRGAQVFNEFWKLDYDPSDPLNTPAGIGVAQPANETGRGFRFTAVPAPWASTARLAWSSATTAMRTRAAVIRTSRPRHGTRANARLPTSSWCRRSRRTRLSALCRSDQALLQPSVGAVPVLRRGHRSGRNCGVARFRGVIP